MPFDMENGQMEVNDIENISRDIERNGSGFSDDKDFTAAREPLLLRKRTLNTTSQIAVIGANVCPIESLDYE